MNSKTLAYEALHQLNRDFQQVVDTIEKLVQLQFCREEFLRAQANRVEELRAIINRRFTEILNHIEVSDAYRFEKLAREYEAPADSSPAPLPPEKPE